MMLKLKLQCFGQLMRRVDSLEKTVMLGEIGGRRRRGWPRMRWLDGITDLMDVGLSELQEMVTDREAWRAAIHGVAKIRTQLSNWTELNWTPAKESTWTPCYRHRPEAMSPGDKHSPYNATEVPQFPLMFIKGTHLKFMFLKITSLCALLPPQVAT